MSAILTLQDDFINKSLATYLPPKMPGIKITITEQAITITLILRVVGIPLKPSVQVRLAGFSWSDSVKKLTLQVLKTYPLDVSPTLAFFNRYLPPFIKINDHYMTLTLSDIPELDEVWQQPHLKLYTIEKFRIEDGQISVFVEYAENNG